MTDQPGSEFAGLLRQLRAEARLTQEELAEAAGHSPRSVSDLERGINRTARKDTGDYAAAAASHQQALALFRDLGNRLGQAEALNRLGELATRTTATGQARQRHSQALAIARELSAAPDEARALEGLGRSHLEDGDLGQAAAYLRQALTMYQRIGVPAARRVQATLQEHNRAADLPVD